MTMRPLPPLSFPNETQIDREASTSSQTNGPTSGPEEWSTVADVQTGGAQTEMDQGAYVRINRVRLIASTERGHYGESAC